MKKVSLGIILPGNPECVQKSGTVLTILEKVFKYGWIAALAGAVLILLYAFNQDSAHLLYMACKLGLTGFCLWLCSALWGKTVRCPYCHHFLVLERISDDKLVGSTSRNISRRVSDYGTGMAYDIEGNTAFFTTKTSHTQNGTETTKRYTYNLRCSCCGCVSKVARTSISKSY